MNNRYKHSFTPYKIGNVEIKNRYTVGPMGGIPFTAKGTYSEDAHHFFIECAKGGFGLLFTNSLASDFTIDSYGPLDRLIPRYNAQGFITDCTFMNERIHSHGTKIFCEITMGPGRNATGKTAPSEIPYFFAPDRKAHALTKEEIKQKIGYLIETAVIAKKAGFDGVDVHAMHWGYLLDSFGMTITNLRDDEYGGSLENRLRVAKEIVEGIKASCGKDFPVSIRLSLKSYLISFNKGSFTGEEENGRTLEEALDICKLLESYGYDALSTDVGTYESFYHACPPSYLPKGNYIPLAAEAKKVVSIPILLAGRMNDPDICEQAIADGKIDAVVLARAALADPYYALKVEKNEIEKIRPCLSCNLGCIGRTFTNGAVSCAVNPQAMRGASYGLDWTIEPKKVMIVGGGVAGMEAARTAAQRGHDVSLYETSDHLGGNLLPAGAHTFKQPILELNDWYKRELEELKIAVHLETKVTPELVRQVKPDAVILATGSRPFMPAIPGVEKSLSSIDALNKSTKIGKKVLVIGGGLVGCEIAMDEAMKGREVTVVEVLDSILSAGEPIPFMNKMCIEEMIDYYHIKVMTATKVKEITDSGARLETVDGEMELEADTVITAAGFCPVPSMAEELDDNGVAVYAVGDGRKVGSIMTAVWDSYEIARGV